MNRENKIIIIFYIFLAISFSSVILYFDSLLVHKDILDIIPRPIEHLDYEKIVKVEQKKFFDIVADVENYPLVLPKNILSVNIIEKGENYVISEETISEQGVQTTLLVKHTFIPFEQHSMKILEGDAKDTLLVAKFLPVGNHTKIITTIDMELEGLLKPFTYIPKRSLNHALHTTITSFETYAQGFDSTYEKIVDDMYREILLRPADPTSLSIYASQLEQGILTSYQLREILENSIEKKILAESYDELISKLNPTTMSTVNNIYRDMLNRDADLAGMAYFGTLLQNNEITVTEIRNAIFESEEGFNTRVDSNEKQVINDFYLEIFSRHATVEELEHYSSMLLSENMTKNEIREELESLITNDNNSSN